MNNRSAILLSGGMDSIALSYWQRPTIAITLDYGQKPARAEIAAASTIAKLLDMEHYIIHVDCSSLGCGDLSDNKPLDMAPVSEWWPYRNQMLVTLGAMKAIQLGVKELMLGSVKTDGLHVDGTKEFYKQLSDLVSMQEGNIVITAPAIDMTTVELIKVSGIPISMLLWAHSCHISNEPCGKCHGCNKYRFVREHLGIV